MKFKLKLNRNEIDYIRKSINEKFDRDSGAKEYFPNLDDFYYFINKIDMSFINTLGKYQDKMNKKKNEVK